MMKDARKRLGLLMAMLVAAACAPSAAQRSTVSPEREHARPGAEAMGPHEGDSVGELRERLERLRVQQVELVPQAAQDTETCEALCSLSTSICSVQEKLCDLADQHAANEEYQSLCREARLECREAEKSCIACVEAHGR